VSCGRVKNEEGALCGRFGNAAIPHSIGKKRALGCDCNDEIRITNDESNPNEGMLE
jgi:hypothetical protein